MGPNLVFMDDNALYYQASCRMSTKRFNKLGVWPPQSLDLNPIEQVWDILGDKVQEKKPRNLTNWGKKARGRVDVWIYRYTEPDSMSRRIAAVIAVKGGHTKY